MWLANQTRVHLLKKLMWLKIWHWNYKFFWEYFHWTWAKKKLIFWQITQFLTSRETKHELLYGTHMGFWNYVVENVLLKMSMPRLAPCFHWTYVAPHNENPIQSLPSSTSLSWHCFCLQVKGDCTNIAGSVRYS